MPNNYCLKEGIMKKGIPPKRRADEVEVNLMIMGLRKISLQQPEAGRNGGGLDWKAKCAKECCS